MMCLPFQTCVRVHTFMIALWACAMFASIGAQCHFGSPWNVQKMRLIAGTAQRKQEINDAESCECLRPATRVLGIDFKENVFIVSPLLEMRTVCKKQCLPLNVCRNCRLPAISGCRCTGPESFHSPHGRLVWTIAAVTDASFRQAWHAHESYVLCWVLGHHIFHSDHSPSSCPLAKDATTWRLALFHLRTHARAELGILRSMDVCTCGFGSWNSPSTRWEKVGGECNLPFRKSRAAMIGLICLMCRMRKVVFPMPQVVLSHVW